MNKAPQTNVSATSLVISCALLAAAIAPAAIAVAWITVGQLSAGALLNAAVGGGVCWLAGAVALAGTYLGNQNHAPVQGILAGMLGKMVIMLTAVVALPRLGAWFATPTIAPTILGVYLVALAIVTTLMVRMVPQQARRA